ncbi:MAG: hypothetical protein ACRYFU_23080 [Janthinobacterium lividum]
MIGGQPGLAWPVVSACSAAQGYLEQVYQASSEVSVTANLAREFFRLIQQ